MPDNTASEALARSLDYDAEVYRCTKDVMQLRRALTCHES